LILFCDTSALIKLYIAELESDALKSRLLEAEAVAVCRIAWVEAHAALARRAREVPDHTDLIEQAKKLLAIDWPRYVVIDVDQSLVEKALNSLIHLCSADMIAFDWQRHLRRSESQARKFK